MICACIQNTIPFEYMSKPAAKAVLKTLTGEPQ